MASEHTLRLKAVLDTQQVQQELQKLKRDAASQTGGSAQQGGGASAQQGFDGVKRLDQTLQRLDRSMGRLERAVEQLSRNQARFGRDVRQSQESARGVNAIPIQSWLQSAAYRDLQNRMSRMVSENRWGAAEMAQFRSMGYGTHLFAHNMLRNSNLFGENDQVRQAAYDRRVQEWYQGQGGDAVRDYRQRVRQARFNRQIGGLIGGQILGNVGSIANDLGFQKTGTVVNALSHGLQAGVGSAMTVGMLGGSNPLSWGLGALIGGGTAIAEAYSGLEKLAQAARDAAEAQRKQGEALMRTGVELTRGRSTAFQEWAAQQALQEKDAGRAKISENWYKEQYDKARYQYFQMESPSSYNKRVQNNLAQRTVVQGISPEEIADLRKDANDQMANYQLRFEAARKEMETAKHLWETWKGVTKELEQQVELEKKKQELEQKRRQSFVDDAADFARRARGSDQFRSTQAFANDILKNERMHPTEQYGRLTKELDQLRAERNAKLGEAYSINKQIEKEGVKMDPKQLEKLAENRKVAVQQAGFLEQRIGALEGALQQIKDSTLPPDFSHMTSLSQYGYNMGEKDDAEKAAQEYYGKMTDLTRQIRDKLDEGITTTATYE